MKKPQPISKADAAKAIYAALEMFEGSSCTTLNIATSASIASETMTTTMNIDQVVKVQLVQAFVLFLL